jgi:Glycosyltransferase 61
MAPIVARAFRILRRARRLLARLKLMAVQRRFPRSGQVLEIDTSSPLPVVAVPDLLAHPRKAQALVNPVVMVHVTRHPLSVLPTTSAEAATYLDHEFRVPELTLERLQDHYWFPEPGYLISQTGKVWRHSILGQHDDVEFRETFAVGKVLQDDGLIKNCFFEKAVGGAPVINDPVLIISHMASQNFGHYMLDMVPLIVAAAEFHLDVASRPMLPWQKTIAAYAGIDPDHIQTRRERVVFMKDVIVSTYHNSMGTYAASPMLRQCFETVFNNIPNAKKQGVSPKRLFISRGETKTRNLRNRAELCRALERLGFMVVRPEFLAFEDQARLFAGADIIVTEYGAVMANVVFSKVGTTVIEIMADDQNDPWSAHLAASLQLEHVVLFHRVNPDDRLLRKIGDQMRSNIDFSYAADIDLICDVASQVMATRAAARRC